MEKLENIIYGFLIMVAITIIVILIAKYNIPDTESKPTTETVSIEINKINNDSI